MSVVLFELSHPKHYLQFRSAIRTLSSEADVRVMARDKDVLLALLEADGVPHESYNRPRHGLWAKVRGVPQVLDEYLRLLRRIRPRLIVSKSSPYAAILGKMSSTTTVVMPDSEGVLLNERFVIPLSDWVVTPATMTRDYGARHQRVSGLFEAAYLHPDCFCPDPSIRRELGVGSDPYAVLRFVAWSANHDAGRAGFAARQQRELIRAIGSRMRVFVSSESLLAEDLRQYRLPTHPSRMHHVLAEAALYVGDSQSMATEAALLGTPTVRCNSFVGAQDFSNFQFLEAKFGLIMNFRYFEDARDKSLEFAGSIRYKEEWRAKSARYFASIGDVNEEIVQFLSGLV